MANIEPSTSQILLHKHKEDVKKAGDTMTGALLAADHGAAATDEVVNVSYGTGAPPAASTTTEGSLYITYTE